MVKAIQLLKQRDSAAVGRIANEKEYQGLAVSD